MPRFARFALGLGVCLFGSSAFAQSALTELYGEGVHRFYAGDLVTAEQYLTRVIDAGVEDPRAYYFRGLVREMQGGGGEYDFESGARLEAEGARSFNVGLALSRIQGYTRAKIEKLRLDARVTAQQQALLMERARTEAGGSVPVAPPAQPVVPPVDATDPFGGPETAPTPPVVDPVQPDVLTYPFADDPAPATDATEPPAATEPADPADPFGGAPAADDPFGDGAAAEVDDPFGN